MNSKSSGIYSITSKVNGNRYIGSSITIDKRLTEHKWLLTKNKHHSTYLQNHVNKYGIDDLVFTVVEVLERNDLPLKEFKRILLEKEQSYLDNWNECQFNMNKRADSSLGSKQLNAKHYSFYSNVQKYKVCYRVINKYLVFGSFKTEQEAKNQVEYIKTLNEIELIKFHELNYKNKTSAGVKKKSGCKGYYKRGNSWRVEFSINGKYKCFGYFKIEEEARKKAEEIKLELGGFY